MAELINLTAHVVRIADEAGTVTHEIPSAGVLRLPINKRLDDTVDGIPIFRTQYAMPPTLPPQRPGVYYIVSSPAAAAIRRSDHIAPATDYTAIRKDGQVYAVRSFVSF